MTILGKVLLFFVLVLSLIWAGLTVNVFVTRTNWASDSKKWQEKAKEAEQSANYQRKLAEETRNASSARISNLQREVEQLKATSDRLTTELASATKQLSDKQVAQQQDIPPHQLLQSNIARLQKQVDLLQSSLTSLERQLNDATVASEKSKADALKASIDRDAALKARDDLETRFLSLSDQLNEVVSGNRGQSARTAPPENFRATVTKVSGDLVEINLGINAKLQVGATLDISRLSPSPRYIGKIVITSVDLNGAVGRFHAKAGVTRPSGEDLPRVGDIASVVK